MARTLLRDPYHDETKVLVALQSYAVNRDGVPVTVTVGERRRGGKGSLVAQHPAWWIEDLSDVEQIAQAQQLQASWRERFARSCRRSARANPAERARPGPPLLSARWTPRGGQPRETRFPGLAAREPSAAAHAGLASRSRQNSSSTRPFPLRNGSMIETPASQGLFSTSTASKPPAPGRTRGRDRGTPPPASGISPTMVFQAVTRHVTAAILIGMVFVVVLLIFLQLGAT